MKGEVFVDSGAFIAFLDRSDALHEEAVTLFASPPSKWCTSVLVVSETHSWFLHRLGEEPARIFRQLLADLPRLRVLDTTRSHRTSVSNKLDSKARR